MILVLRKDVVKAMAEDLYQSDANAYTPVWKIEDGGWHDDRRNPIKEIERFVRLVNTHSRGQS